MGVLETAGLPWYITGSEALAAYGSPRQTMDVDVVVDATPEVLERLTGSLTDRFYYAQPIRVGKRTLASLVESQGGGKVDLIVRDPDPWAAVAMSRRLRWQHPTWGSVWLSSLEDLILAKLEWSEGISELQLRDCRMLWRMNAGRVEQDYLETWAQQLGVSEWLARVREVGDAS